MAVELPYGEKLAQTGGAGFSRSMDIDDEVLAVYAFIVFFLEAFRFGCKPVPGADIVLGYGALEPAEDIIVDGDGYTVEAVAA